MLKTLIQPQPPNPLAVSCIADRRASGSERGELRLTREEFIVCICGHMYMKCVSRFLEGLACQQTQGQHDTHKCEMNTRTQTHTRLQILPAADALKGATL